MSTRRKITIIALAFIIIGMLAMVFEKVDAAIDRNKCYCEYGVPTIYNRSGIWDQRTPLSANPPGVVSLSYVNYIWSRNIFCVQAAQEVTKCYPHVTFPVAYYGRVGRVEIVEGIATDHNGVRIGSCSYGATNNIARLTAMLGKVCTHDEQLSDAGIFGGASASGWSQMYQSLPDNVPGGREERERLWRRTLEAHDVERANGSVQKGIWQIMYYWMNAARDCGFSWLPQGFSTADGNGESRYWVEANDYATQLERAGWTMYKNPEDKTNRSGISCKPYTINGTSYTRVGPFNWTFPGKIDGAITVQNQSGNAIGGLLYSGYNGNTEYFHQAKDIKSGTNFYIFVPVSSGATKITNIVARAKYAREKVVIEFLKSPDVGSWQNFIAVNHNTENVDVYTNFSPYNIPMLGNIQLIKEDQDNTNIKLQNVGFIFQQVSTGKYLRKEANGSISYVDRNQATEFLTNQNGMITVSNVTLGQYKAYEIRNPNYGYIIPSTPETINLSTAGGTATKHITNLKQTGNIGIVKVNQDDQTVTLSGVEFTLQYIDGPFSYYTEGENKGKVWMKGQYVGTYKTDSNGKLAIKDLLAGTYKIYEVRNPHYGYVFTDEGTTIIVGRGTTNKTLKNKQKYVKLSGYIWLDKPDDTGKETNINHLFKTEKGMQKDRYDVLVNGITVRLMDRTKTGSAAIVKTTTTARLNHYQESGHNGNGEYLFTDVLTDKLNDYYIQFTYDGLTYTNVIPYINQNRGSKASESVQERDNFNKNFTSVEGETRTTGFTREEKGNRKHNLSYTVNETKHEANLVNSAINETPKYPIVATTDAGNYRIRTHFTWGQEEVKYINLGIYEREQPDMAVVKDLQSVKLAINGYEHVYEYAQRFAHEAEYNKEGSFFNVGVKFGNKYGGVSYRRAIYEADYTYKNEKDPSRELKVYVTYEIRMKNKSSTLSTKINSLVDYYDANFNLINVGTEINQDGTIKKGKELKYKLDDSYNRNGFRKMIINTDKKLDKEVGKEESKVYVQFEIKEAIENLVNQKKQLENVVEINSYSIYDKTGKIYAGIDKNSNPGNCVPGDKRTYEDDTDSSPSLLLEPTDAREMSGKVFLDATTGELKTGQIRQGNGRYDTVEKGISGVKVELIEINNNVVTKSTETDANGDYFFTEYVPGDYILQYTWGDETYTVQAYKGTIYDQNRDQNNKRWWYEGSKENAVRWNDAMDDYDIRLEIDEELKRVIHNTTTTKTKMKSATPTMGIGIEYETNYTASTGNKYVYRINNIDFGIVERARQEIALNKRVKTLKATLASGQVIANLTVKEDERGNRTLTGERSGVTYIQPSPNVEPKSGLLRLEMDNELIQGCILEVGYEIKVDNISEVDYYSKNYYTYGMIEGNKMTIEPTGMIDYMDNEWAFDRNKNPKWQVTTLNEIKRNNLVAKPVYDDRNSTINEKIVLYTEGLKGKHLEPETAATIMLQVSKVLTTTDEIYLENETEIIELNKTGGPKPTLSTPGNYVPGTGKIETDDSMAEVTIVTPATGGNRNYFAYISLTISVLGILIAGILLIKKKVIEK